MGVDSSLPSGMEAWYFHSILRTLRRILGRIEHLPLSERESGMAVRLMSPEADRSITSICSHMAQRVWTHQKGGWRQAASRWASGQRIYRALLSMSPAVGSAIQEMIGRNAEMVRQVPLEAARETLREIYRLEQMGVRPKAIARAWRERFPQHTRARAMMIARTESMKASSALLRAQASSLGLNWYEWETSHDGRVRPSHRLMNGVLVRYDDPPLPEMLMGKRTSLFPGHAGEFPNCRCTQIVVLSPERLRWPHKVYSHGRIRSVSLAEFRRMM